MFEKTFPQLLNFGAEVRTHPNYQFQNSDRGISAQVVVQRIQSGRCWFKENDRITYATAGTALLFTYLEPTAYGYPENDTAPCALDFINVDIAGLAPLFARIRQDYGSIVSMGPDREASALYEELVRRFKDRTFSDRLHVAELIHRMLIALYREQVQQSRSSDPIEFGHEYLRSHYRSPVNLKMIADKCGVSREHFIRVFTRRYGESPGALLRRLRLEQAKLQLSISPDKPVEDVALDCGYASANTFCRAYRIAYGKSPRS